MGLSIAANTLISTLGRAVGVVISLIVISRMAGYLGQAGFGTYAAILAFVFIFNYLADLGLYSIVVRDLAHSHTTPSLLVGNAFALRLTALVASLILAPLIGLFISGLEGSTLLILATLPFYLFSSLAQVLMGVFQKHFRTDWVVLAEITGRLSQLALVVWLISIDLGVLGMLLALSGSAAINFGLTLFFARRFVAFKLEFDFKTWAKILKQSWPIGLAVLLTVIYFKLDTVMLAAFRPASEVGIYALGYRVLEALIFFPAMFAGIIMPLLSKSGLRKPAQFRQVLQQALNILLAVTVPLVAFLFIKAGAIIGLLDQKHEFSEAAGVVAILSGALLAIYLGALFSNALIAINRQRSLTLIYAVGALVNIGLNFLVIPKYSYLGASATTVATEFLVTGLMLIALPLHLSWRLLPVLSASFLMVLGLILGPTNLIASTILGGLIYFVSLWLLGGLPKKELDFLKARQVV